MVSKFSTCWSCCWSSRVYNSDGILKSMGHMTNVKMTGPSVIVVEMLKAPPDICCKTIADLMNTIIFEGKAPADLTDSIIVGLFKGKGNALDQNNY